jgi:hypothetical protein
LYQESFSILYFFFNLPSVLAMPMPTAIGASIFPRGEVSYAKFLFLPSWFAKLLEANISFAKIKWMPN